MRVLHIANFSWFSSSRKRADNVARYYATDRKISNGLIRNGCCVLEFSYRDTARHFAPLSFGKKIGAKKMNANLLSVSAAFKPDLILLGHAELVLPQTLAALRQQHPKTKIAQWWVDPFAPHSLLQLRAKQPYLDAFFATTAPAHFTPLLNDETLKSKTPSYYLPNIVDSSVEIEQGFKNKSYLYDIFFAGENTPERTAVLDIVKQIPNIKRGFFGIDGAPLLAGAALHETIAAAKIGLNLSRADNIPLYSSDRLAQLAGNGCCILSPRVPQMQTLFTENEICYFDDYKELPSLIAALLEDETRRRAIARAGWQRAHSCYNEKRICRFIVEAALGDSFSENYEWI